MHLFLVKFESCHSILSQQDQIYRPLLFKPQSNSCPQIMRGSWADQQGSLPAKVQHLNLFWVPNMPRNRVFLALLKCIQIGNWLPGIQCGDEFMLLGWKIVWMKSPTKNLHRCHGPRSVDHRRSRAFTASEFTAAMRKRPLVIKLLGPLDTSVSLWFLIAKLKRWVVVLLTFLQLVFA